MTEPPETTERPRRARTGPWAWALLAALSAVLIALSAMLWLMDPRPRARPPDQVRLSWTGDPRTSVVIVWHTVSDDRAEVRVSSATTDRTVPGAPTDGRPKGSGYWFQADVTGLDPGTTYTYAIRSGRTITPSYQFTTERKGAHAIRFDVFGDQGDCVHYGAACRVMDGIARDRPDFVLGCGDLTYADDHGPEAADSWAKDTMRYYSTWAPLMPTPGNHEYLPGTGLGDYKARFAVPAPTPASGQRTTTGNGDYYSFTYGSVHIVALPEHNVPMGPNSAFQRWLKADLRRAAADPTIKWRIAFGHRPFYSTGRRHGPDRTYTRYVQPVLEKYRMDLVLSGHEHEYERTLPLRDGVVQSTNAGSWAKGTGTAYVVTGGGGAPTYNDFGPAQPWDAVRKSGHEHLVIDIDAAGTTLRVAAVDDDAQHVVFDRFVIRRSTSRS